MADKNFLQRAVDRIRFGDLNPLPVNNLPIPNTNLPASMSQGVQRVKIIKTDRVGSPGTQIFSGYITEEYLNILRSPRKKAEIFDEMRRSDSDVVMCLRAVKDIIIGALYDVDPGEDTEEAIADRDMIYQMLFCDMENPFSQFIQEAITCIEFGFSVFEETHKIIQNHPKFGTYVTLKNLDFRYQRTIERWNVDENGNLLSVTQIAYGDMSKYVDLPGQFCHVFSVNKEGKNFDGISYLRGAYGPFIRKKEYMKLNAIGVEKFAIPTPVAKVPEQQIKSEGFEKFKQALEDFVGHESNYLIIPNDWDVQLVTNTYDPSKVEESINAEGRRIVNAFLANFLLLGSSGSGSWALSTDQSDFFLSGIDYIPKMILNQLNRTLIPRLVQMNRGPREKYPILKHSGIMDKGGKELAEVLKFLGDSQWLKPDDKSEKFLRTKYGLPPADPTTSREVQKTSGLGTFGMSELMQRIKMNEKRKGL